MNYHQTALIIGAIRTQMLKAILLLKLLALSSQDV